MRSGKPGLLLALAALFTISGQASAQDVIVHDGDVAPERPTPCARGSRIQVEDECAFEGSSLGPESLAIERNMEVAFSVEGRSLPTRQCLAVAALNYYQKVTLAHVDGTVDNPTCGPSSGSMVIAVRTRDANGEHVVQEYTREWSREDNQSVNFSAEYPIGENVDLVRVRSIKLSCTCTEEPPATAPQE